MRSLALKLTLAFLAVSLTGVGLIAIFVNQQTQREFDRFVLDRNQLDMIDELADYYATNGSWRGVGPILIANRDRRPGDRRPEWLPVTLVNANNVVVVGGLGHQPGQQLSRGELKNAYPVEVEGEVVGRVLLPTVREPEFPVPNSPEDLFIRAIQRAIFYSALVATAVALLLGVLLARTISNPVRELTQATHRVADGDLTHEVPVRTKDEIGELATSFNQMTSNLAQANQLRRQMTADIAHDLRTPTSVIMGYTEALSDGKLTGSSEMYDIMHKEARHLNRLIEDLRTLSLADAGELSLLRRPVDPLVLLEGTAVAQQVKAQNQGVILRIANDSNLPPINIDPERMTQVLGNLVNNALRYTATGGEITLSAQQAGDQVVLRVHDTGAGIAPEDLPHIFRRFYRSDKARSQSGESGLGLAIVRSIVEAHDGRITVDSTLGQGTTFSIYLPVASNSTS